MYRHGIIILALGIACWGCAENQTAEPSAEESLLINGEFATPRKSTSIISIRTILPWWSDSSLDAEIVADPGADGKPGYISMWGDAAHYAILGQGLEHPIVAGRTYILQADIRYHPQPSPIVDHGVVEFVAFTPGSDPQMPLQRDGSGRATIGTVTTNTASWKSYTLGEWKAESGYKGFAIIGRNDIQGDGSASMKSRMDIDNVRLVEKK